MTQNTFFVGATLVVALPRESLGRSQSLVRIRAGTRPAPTDFLLVEVRFHG
jgi:hypothetical protein